MAVAPVPVQPTARGRLAARFSFPQVKQHAMRNGAGNPVTGLRLPPHGEAVCEQPHRRGLVRIARGLFRGAADGDGRGAEAGHGRGGR